MTINHNYFLPSINQHMLYKIETSNLISNLLDQVSRNNQQAISQLKDKVKAAKESLCEFSLNSFSKTLKDEHLLYLKNLPLNELHCLSKLTKKGFQHLNTSRLENLDLNNCDLKNEDLKPFQNSPLKSLTLFNSPKLTKKGFQHLNTSRLENLSLGRCDLKNEDLEPFQTSPLKSLNLSTNPKLTKTGFQYLNVSTLKTLVLFRTQSLTGADLEPFQTSPLKSLLINPKINELKKIFEKLNVANLKILCLHISKSKQSTQSTNKTIYQLLEPLAKKAPLQYVTISFTDKISKLNDMKLLIKLLNIFNKKYLQNLEIVRKNNYIVVFERGKNELTKGKIRMLKPQHKQNR